MVKRSIEVKTFGEIGAKWMIELVADRERANSTQLLFWYGTKEEIRRELVITLPNQTYRSVYRPAEISPNLLRVIYLPDHPEPYGSTRELFEQVRTVIRKFTPLSEDSVALLAQAVLASWVVEALEVPPCLALVGPVGPERRQVLRLLRCLFRRGLVLSGVSLSSLSSLPVYLTPSLLIERIEASTTLHAFLLATSSPEAYVAAGGKLINFCCAKVFCTEDSLDRSLQDFPVLEIPLVLGESSVPFFDQRAQKKVLDEFQPKLLKYRLTNFYQVRESHSELSELRAPWRDIATCFAATAAGDTELQTNVTELIKNQEKKSTLDSDELFQKVVLEATLRLCHRTKANMLMVGAIARQANNILIERGETLTLDPRAVGSILRALHIPTERLGAQGRGITLLRRTLERIHFIAMDHHVLLESTEPKDCPICLEADPALRTSDDLSKMSPEELDELF